MDTSTASDLRRLQEHLRVLSNATKAFSQASRSTGQLFDAVVREVAESLHCACIVNLISDDGEHFTSKHVHADEPDFLRECRANIGEEPNRIDAYAPMRHVVGTRTPLLVPRMDAGDHPGGAELGIPRWMQDLRIRTRLLVPFIVHDRVAGTLGLLRRGEDAPLLDEQDLSLVQSLAEHAALALATARFIEEAERASRLLRESEEAHRLLFDASPLPLFVFDVETLAPLAANPATLRLFGYDESEFMRLPTSALSAAGREAARARVAAWGDAEESGAARYRRKDGTEFVGEFTTRPLVFAGRRARIAVIHDTTERREAEQTRALLAAIVQSSNDAIVSKRLDGTITSWNAAAQQLFGWSADEAIGQPIAIIVPPGRLDEERALLARVTAGERVDHFETVRRRKDGTDVPISVSIAPVLDAAGEVVGASKTARDLTQVRKAEEALRRSEEQLRQAQKMEAVGRLAGGVAHDFNNILTVILTYSTTILADTKPGDPIHTDVEEIRQAGVRASELTKQLLMFSRQQVVEPKVLDLNELLARMDRMLKRILGEDVDLVSVQARELGRIRADPGGVEQVIMNLVVNARDAMPTGGNLTIETADVDLDDEYARVHLGSKPGPHVMLAVSDTGVGMDQATQSRIFEPFFTTKEEGKGTGLGLSTVFGIAQQCGGSVWVYSEPGKGTTFKVYFPRVQSDVDLPEQAAPPVTLRGQETILLVEDQEQVRTVAQGILKRNGYRVIVAKNAGEALLLCEKHPGTIHLLLTDVVMPQMSGPELSKRLAGTRADMKVLCMSGYTDDSIVRHGVLESGMAFLQKPFTPDSLARKVREVLNSSSKGRP